MNDLEFLKTALPAEGKLCLAVPQGSGFKHFYFDTPEQLLQAAQHIDANRKLNVYYAISSYKDGSSRKQSNVHRTRSFILDVDVGQGKPYPTQREAASAVLRFAEVVGLPRPYIVKSGGGIHVYWPVDADMLPEVWLPTAQLLKAACKAEGLHADPSRTSDHASVLRPPGVHHRKGDPKLVVVAVEGEVAGLDDIQQAVIRYAGGVDISGPSADDDLLGPAPAHIRGAFGDGSAEISDLSAGVEFRPSKSAYIAEKCGVLALMRDTKGNVDQPTWYHSLGVMAFTTDGAEIAQAWSSGHPDYSAMETETKLLQAAAIGHPTSCAKLSDFQPAICQACPHFGKIKTPYTLGMYDKDEVRPKAETTVVDAAGNITSAVVEMAFPIGYKRRPATEGHMQLTHLVPHTGEDGAINFREEAFSDSCFYPVSRMWIEDASQVECLLELPRGGVRRFTIDSAIIGKGKDSLAGILARQEIVPLPNKGPVMDAYMKKWLTHLKFNAEIQTSSRHFGWTEEKSFVLGERTLHPGGGDTRTILVGMAKSKESGVTPKGNLQAWIDNVDRAYNAPGQEGYQFIVACGFAAPLLSMFAGGQINGVTVYAHSEGSGVGKTTAQKVALSAWGDWDQLMLADNKITANAMWGLMGAYHSLPIVFDELTNQKNDVASDLVFSVSSGRAKQRMRADGELRENTGNWRTIMLASGNTLLSEKLALHRGNAEAEMSRLFEFTLSATPHLSVNEANEVFPRILDNYGHAGRAFARYITDHYSEVEQLLRATQAKLNTKLGITQVERYWSALLASAMVAVSICRKLGLLQFDLAGLHNWLVARLAENRVQRIDAAVDPLVLFGTMLSDLWQGILVTNGEGDMRRGQPANVVEKPRGPLVGRAILPTGGNTKAVLMLSRSAVNQWTNSKGVSAREIFIAAVRAGWADKDFANYSLGRGTLEYSQLSSYVPCWKVDPDRIAGQATGPVSQKLGAITGGKTDTAGSGT